MNTDSPLRSVCTFSLGDHLFGVEVLLVQEVIRHQEMTRVPLADPVLHGLINLRGQIVAAIDLRTLLRQGPRPDGITPVNIVVGTDCGVVSLLADEVGDVIEVDTGRIETAPPTVDAMVRAITDGVVRLKDGLLLLVNPAKITGSLAPEHAA